MTGGLLGTCSGRTLEVSCDPRGSVMLSYLYSLDVSPDDLSSVPVVSLYHDVFEDVTDLPPRREVDFRIYLVDNARPVTLPVLHMAPKERIRISYPHLLLVSFLLNILSLIFS